MSTARVDFASDNTAGICPEAWAKLAEANYGSVTSYGQEEWTSRLRERVRDIFESDCAVYLVFNGTAANALALAQLARSFNSVICHEHAHIENDECGACEFHSGGGKLIPTPGENGKVDLAAVEIALSRQQELHSHKPRVISLTQATEMGTVYSLSELRPVSEFARSRDLLVHMDGARFANAVAALGCTPKELTSAAGVDVLCFGGTKNGLAAGELVIFFEQRLGQDFEYRVKQSGQLASKARFLAAPWLGLLENGVWLKNALRANSSARCLAAGLERAGAEIVFPVDANSVFLRLEIPVAQQMRALGWEFYKFLEPDVYRLICSWSADDAMIASLLHDFQVAKGCASAAAA